MSSLTSLLAQLIEIPSITPDDLGCQTMMIDFLKQLGFNCQQFDNPPVNNFFARLGTQSPLLVFAGHTDVVPVGDEDNWLTPPFQLTEIEGMGYGRGVADMKGSLAAMLTMAERFSMAFPTFSGSLGFLITSGEEGDLFDKGTPYVMKKLHEQRIAIDYCIVGEPSSSHHVGDVIKIGRRGSLTGKLVLQGKQGHVAYPHLAINPIHIIAPWLEELTSIQWDEGNEFFPPTTLQITHLNSGGIAGNIIPGELILQFNVRFSTEQTAEKLTLTINELLIKHNLNPTVHWQLNGQPFLTSQGKLLTACQRVIESITTNTPTLSTSGGTSDGRFIAPYGVEVVELGPVNATIHQTNECVSIKDLECLSDLYFEISKELLNTN